jgi:PAS domain S-box-containing protein
MIGVSGRLSFRAIRSLKPPIIFFLLLIFCRPCWALDPSTPFRQFVHNQWTSVNGLPQNSAAAILQTRDGYIWFGTEEGLVRFNGVEFTVFNKNNTEAIPYNYVVRLLEGRDGSLWILLWDGGRTSSLVRYRNGQFHLFTAEEGLPTFYGVALLQDSNDDIWIPTQNTGLIRYHNCTFSDYSTKDGLKSNRVDDVGFDTKGNFWIFTTQGSSRLAAGKITSLSIPGVPDSEKIHGVVEDRNGDLWFGSEHGLIRVPQGDFSRPPVERFLTHVPIYPYLIDGQGGIWGFSEGAKAFRFDIRKHVSSMKQHLYYIIQDGNGTIWAATKGRGVCRITDPANPEKLECFSPADGLLSDSVRSIFEDREGSLWIGTQGGGLEQFRDTAFTTYGVKQGLTGSPLSIQESSKGGFLAAMQSAGLQLFEKGQVRKYQTAYGPESNFAAVVMEDKNGHVWEGTQQGFFEFSKDARLERAFGLEAVSKRTDQEKYGLLSRDIRWMGFTTAIYQDRNGNIWIGSDGLLSRVVNGKLVPYISNDGASLHRVRLLFEDRAGDLWIGAEEGLVRLRNNLVVLRISDCADATSLLESSNGAIWMGTASHGLKRYKDGVFTSYTSKNGLPVDGILAVLEDGQGFLWMSSNLGISRVSEKELNDFADKKISRVHGMSYDESDGMPGLECNGGVQGSGFKAHDGGLFFACQGGVVEVDPSRLPPSAPPPPVVVEQASANRMDDLRWRPEAPAGRGDLEFHFAALSYRDPGKIQYQYKLEGYDPDWVSNGNRRTAYYTNIPPGRYRFLVTATTKDGVKSRADAVVNLHLVPRYYQTKWFLSLCGLAALLMAAAIYRLRIRSIVKREAALQKSNDELREAQASLRASESRFRRLVESNIYGVAFWKVSGEITDANDCFLDLVGYSRQELEAGLLHMDALVAPEFRDATEKMFLDLATSGTCQPMEKKFIAKSGERIPVLVGAAMFEGSSTNGLSFALDLRQRALLEEKLRQSQKLESVALLAAGVAHDFNNLLTVIQMNSSQLLSEAIPARTAEPIKEISAAARRAATLTRQLLTFSRRQPMEITLLAINDVVEGIGRMLRRVIGEQVDLQIHLARSLPPIRADKGMLEQILANLAINARDAMPLGGRLSISTSLDLRKSNADMPPGNYVTLRVVDEGTGMSPEVLEHIFDPFFTTKPTGQGTGLGLATVYGIVKQHSGHIQVRSEPGRGTCFTVSFPAVGGEPDDVRQDAHPAANTTEGDESVLVVEDEEGIRDIITTILTKNGYRVLVAHDCDTSLRLIAEHPEVHLLLCDLVTPGKLKGRELAEAIRVKSRDIKVVFMSGYSADAPTSVESEMGYFLAKPFASNELLGVIRKALDTSPFLVQYQVLNN